MSQKKATFLAALFLASTGLLQASSDAFVAPAGWAAYFHDPKSGRDANLVQPMEKNPDKDWVGLAWTDYKGVKLPLAVMQVENKAAQGVPAGIPAALAAMYGAQYAQIPVAGIGDLLTSSLQATGRFRLYERKAIESLMAEKGLIGRTQADQVQTSNLPGLNSPDPAVRAKAMQELAAQMQNNQNQQAALQQATLATQGAKLVGARYAIFASVVEWTPDKSQKNVGLGGIGGSIGGLFGVNKKEAEVAMSFRIVDTDSGEVKWSLDERATAGNWGFDILGLGAGNSGVAGGGGGMQEKTPINYAIKACINKAAYRIAGLLRNQPWQGAVIRSMPDGKVFVNAGKDAGLQPGMVLQAQSVGEALKDPTTGEVLDMETKPAGAVTLTEVRDRIAIGTRTDAPAGLDLKPGDRLTLSVGTN